MTGSSLEFPLTLWMAYWDCLTGNGYIEPVYGEDMTGTVQSIYTSENLYRFPGGNIFFAGNSFDEQNIFCLYKERFLAFLLVVSD